jgi:hypothetical protein
LIGCNRKAKQSPTPEVNIPFKPSSTQQPLPPPNTLLPLNIEFDISPDRIPGIRPISEYASTGFHTIGQERIVSDFSQGKWATLEWYFKLEGQTWAQEGKNWAAEDHKEHFFGFLNNQLVLIITNYNSEKWFNSDRQNLAGKLQTVLMDQHSDSYVSGAMWGSIGKKYVVKYILQKPVGEDPLIAVFYDGTHSPTFENDYNSIKSAIINQGGKPELIEGTASESASLDGAGSQLTSNNLSNGFDGPFGFKAYMTVEELGRLIGDSNILNKELRKDNWMHCESKIAPVSTPTMDTYHFHFLNNRLMWISVTIKRNEKDSQGVAVVGLNEIKQIVDELNKKYGNCTSKSSVKDGRLVTEYTWNAKTNGVYLIMLNDDDHSRDYDKIDYYFDPYKSSYTPTLGSKASSY